MSGRISLKKAFQNATNRRGDDSDGMNGMGGMGDDALSLTPAIKTESPEETAADFAKAMKKAAAPKQPDVLEDVPPVILEEPGKAVPGRIVIDAPSRIPGVPRTRGGG